MIALDDVIEFAQPIAADPRRGLPEGELSLVVGRRGNEARVLAVKVSITSKDSAEHCFSEAHCAGALHLDVTEGGAVLGLELTAPLTPTDHASEVPALLARNAREPMTAPLLNTAAFRWHAVSALLDALRRGGHPVQPEDLGATRAGWVTTSQAGALRLA